MADLTIKPQAGSGNKLIIQDQAGNARVTTSDAGIDIPAVTGNLTVAGDIVPSTPLSHRNMIINGGMQVWQRATAATTTNYAGSGYKTVDRWSFDPTPTGVMTTEKHSMSLAEINTTGHHTALKAVCTTADTSIASGHYGRIKTHLEAQDLQQLQYGTANAKTMTLSFWIKSNKTGVYCFSIYKADSTNYEYIKEFTISSADTWEKKTIVITPTAGSTSFMTSAAGIINNDNTLGLQLNIGLAWGSSFHGSDDAWTTANHYATSNQVNWFDSTSNNLYLTGVQLELGSNATPFEHRSYGDELIRCMRYFEWASDYTGYANSTSACDGGMSFKVAKRSTSYTGAIVIGASMLAHPHVVAITPTGVSIGGNQKTHLGCYVSFSAASGVFSQGGTAKGIVSMYYGTEGYLSIDNEL